MNRHPCRLSTVIVSIALFWSAFAVVPAVEAKSPRTLYKQVLRATALVQVTIDKEQTASGTGWLVDRSRKLLITNYHVVAPTGKVATEVRVIFPAFRQGRAIGDKSYYDKNVRPIKARVIVRDAQRDLAVLRLASVPRGVAALTLAKFSPQPGDRCHSVGNPGTSAALWVYTMGTVRQVARQQIKYPNGQNLQAVMVETQSPINPGDSGSALVNDAGQLIGVNANHNTKAQLVARAIDVTEVRKVLAHLLRVS